MERAAGYNPNSCCSTWGATNFGKFVEELRKIYGGAGHEGLREGRET